MSKGLIPNFTTGVFEVERSAPGFFKNGRFKPGEKEIVHISGSLQPIGPRDIKQMTEGERLQDHFWFFSDVPLVTITTQPTTQSDIIKINSETYRVMGVEEWSNFGSFTGVDLPHFKTRLIREPQQ